MGACSRRLRTSADERWFASELSTTFAVSRRVPLLLVGLAWLALEIWIWLPLCGRQ